MPLDPEYLPAAVFGRQVEDFLASDIGKYLVARAEEQRERSIERLKTANPWRRQFIQRCQNEVRVVDMFQQWMADAILEGQAALAVLEGEDE
jgi:hypothetical protein